MAQAIKMASVFYAKIYAAYRYLSDKTIQILRHKLGGKIQSGDE